MFRRAIIGLILFSSFSLFQGCESGSEEPSDLDKYLWSINNAQLQGYRWEGHGNIASCAYTPLPPDGISSCLSLQNTQSSTIDPSYPVNVILTITNNLGSLEGDLELTIPHFNSGATYYKLKVIGSLISSNDPGKSLISLIMVLPPPAVNKLEMRVISLAAEQVGGNLTGTVTMELTKEQEPDQANLTYSFVLNKII